MNPRGRYQIVLVTAPDMKTARRLAGSVLRSHLAACANMLPGVESHYWWGGRIQKDSEVLLLFKTTQPRLAKLERLVLRLHPYDTPEIIALGLDGGNGRYLKWLRQCCEDK